MWGGHPGEKHTLHLMKKHRRRGLLGRVYVAATGASLAQNTRRRRAHPRSSPHAYPPTLLILRHIFSGLPFYSIPVFLSVRVGWAWRVRRGGAAACGTLPPPLPLSAPFLFSFVGFRLALLFFSFLPFSTGVFRIAVRAWEKTKTLDSAPGGGGACWPGGASPAPGAARPLFSHGLTPFFPALFACWPPLLKKNPHILGLFTYVRNTPSFFPWWRGFSFYSFGEWGRFGARFLVKSFF